MSLPTSLATETGHASGLQALPGWPDDPSEPVLELLWPLSVRVYDRMRRDSKLAAVLRAWTHPIRNADWSIDPNGASDNVVQLVAEDLGLPILGDTNPRTHQRARGRFSWPDHVRLALLALTYGHMPFEQVYDPEALKQRGEARLRKLAPRMPQTIYEINVARDGGLVDIVQHPAAGQIGTAGLGPRITVDRLVMYVNDREGGAWQGQSLLRDAYGAWLLKQDAMRTHAVSIRRNGMGVPVAEAPKDASQPQIDELAKLARAYRGGEKAGGAIPFGGRLRLLGVEGSLPDTVGWIRYLDEQMAGAALAEFMKLGSSQSGSRALGSTFVDLFTLALNGCATDLIGDTVTAHVVEDLVDLNFGETEQAPRVVHSPITVDEQAVLTSIQGLIASGALTADDGLEQYLRDQLRVPQRTTPRPAAPPAAPAPAPMPVAAQTATPRPPVQVAAAAPRQPEPHEEHVDFDRLQNEWQDALNALLPLVNAQRTSQLDAVIADLTSLLDAGDLAGLAALTGPGGASSLIGASLASLAGLAAQEAVAEAARQGVVIPLPELDLAELAARAEALDGLLARSLGDVAARQALQRYADGLDPAVIAGQVRDHIEGLTDTYVRDMLGGALTGAQNTARLTTFSGADHGRFYASELLDGRTCATCAAVDGHEYDSSAVAAMDYPSGGYRDCLGGPRCRGTVVFVAPTEAPASA